MDSFTWDGTEDGLYNLIIWWGTRVPVEHKDECDHKTLHGCVGEPVLTSNAILESSPRKVEKNGEIPVLFRFIKGKRAGKGYEMYPGDTLFYEGDGKFAYKESFECVVISQDWP